MKPVLQVLGPRNAGPGERQEMLDRARQLLEQAEATEHLRVDVPGRGVEEAGSRAVMESLVPALQSGSIFGGRRGLQVVDAQNLHRGEAELLADLVAEIDAETATVVFVSAGALPPPLSRVVRRVGEVLEVKQLRERDAAAWLAAEVRRRGLRLRQDALSSLLQRFGSDVGGMSRALDQLGSSPGTITAETILARFRNRPDEPMWHYVDALSSGDTGEALRRLADFLTHAHPLQLLAFLENDLRRRALAASAPDVSTFAEWVGGSPEHYAIQKVWRQRNSSSDSELRRALDALARADAHLKSAPEETHRLTMERLTVALCRWYGAPAQRAG
ncbi:MAG: hypothetical protein M3N51_00460 [Actinomycetota bacterium]|nr:hypothetical protein [Actinomycetota bacterium]